MYLSNEDGHKGDFSVDLLFLNTYKLIYYREGRIKTTCNLSSIRALSVGHYQSKKLDALKFDPVYRVKLYIYIWAYLHCHANSLENKHVKSWWPSCLDRGALIIVDAPGCGMSVVRGPTGHK